MPVTPRPSWNDASALLKRKGDQLYFSEAPRALQLAVGLGAVGKGVMTISPFLGKLFFVPLAVGATMMGGSFLLLVAAPVSLRLDKAKNEVTRWRKGLRLPGTRRHRLDEFDRVTLVTLEGGDAEVCQHAVRLEASSGQVEPLSVTIIQGSEQIAMDLAARIAGYAGFVVYPTSEPAEVAIAHAAAGAVPPRPPGATATAAE